MHELVNFEYSSDEDNQNREEYKSLLQVKQEERDKRILEEATYTAKMRKFNSLITKSFEKDF